MSWAGAARGVNVITALQKMLARSRADIVTRTRTVTEEEVPQRDEAVDQ